MPESYQDRRKTPKKAPASGIMLRLGKLILKQTSASLLCLAVVLGMHNASSPHLNGYADALGKALRYETDISALLQIGDTVKERFFPAEDSPPLPESDQPLTEH